MKTKVIYSIARRMPNTEKYFITSGIVGSKSEHDLDMSNILLTHTHTHTHTLAPIHTLYITQARRHAR
jgi:hypothetical protein